MTVNELCEGICSDRQYRKYLTGDNNISDQRIMEFCEKLGISARDFYFSLNEKDAYEFDKIRNIYLSILKKDYDKATQLLKQIQNIDALNIQNERFIHYCLIRSAYEQGKINALNALKQATKLVNYPECEHNDVFDFVEFLDIDSMRHPAPGSR